MNIKIKQHGITDCGAACLASVAAFYKLKIPLARIRQYASTDREGTNILGMVEGAERLGFTAKGVKGPPESLKKVPKPVIAHVVIKDSLHHYMVIYKTGKKHLKVMDPASGHMHCFNYNDFYEIWTGILILLIPGNEFEPASHEISVGRRFLALIYPHKKVMLQALLGALIYTVLGLSTSIYIQKITDYVLTDGNRNLLNMMSVAVIVILLFQLFIGVTRTVFTIRTGQQIDARMILGYYKHLLQLPRRFFDTMRIGEIVSRIDDAVKIRAFINDAAINVAVNVFIVVFSFALMFTYYWKLALIMLSIIPLYVVVYFITDRLNKRVQRRIMEEGAELESQLVESLNAIGTIKLFGIESYADIKTETRFIALLKTVYKSSLNGVFSNTSTVFLSNIFTVLLLWIGAGYVLENRITPGELLSFYALTAYFTGPAGSLIGINKMARDAWVAADRLFEIMDLERERSEETFHFTKAMLGDISFENVHFRYGSRSMVFEGLTMRIPSGKVTAITGESGSGKTTLISLLQHVYPVQQGIIRIGNYDLKYISRGSLRNLLGVVPQQIDLFAGNVVENIALGDFGPDMRRILDLCMQLGMTGFIEGLPDGFRTYLGENGALLSGGQKQRIAIARALYKQPEILILDEATSSLDPESEQYVQEVVRLLKRQGKTVIIIAHRMSTVRHADKIIVLKKGKVIEEGSHDELIAVRKNYYNLWNRQMQEL